MRALEVAVRQAHINAGEPASCPSCAIALAIRDALPGAQDVRVFNDGAHIRMSDRKLFGADFPAEVFGFMHRFDAREPVRPFTFTAAMTEVAA